MESLHATRNAALVVAHPGHELRVYGWLEATRPHVFVMTDGSGRKGSSRLQSTVSVLDGVGARPGSVFGRFTDQSVYQATLNHDYELFNALARELAEEFIRERIDYVAGDAEEGYNTAHDICRLVLDAAVAIASRERGLKIDNYDFLLTGGSAECPERLRERAVWLRLDDATMKRKLTAAGNYSELAAEVEAAIRENGSSAFRVECLRPVERVDGVGRFDAEQPYYELYGEQQVAAGHYEKVISYREHILPIAAALRECVGEGGR
jgi:predicted DNA-binding ribbon-helix-helix protein